MMVRASYGMVLLATGLPYQYLFCFVYMYSLECGKIGEYFYTYM